MLDRDVRFEGFDAEDWTRLVGFLRTREEGEGEPGLVVVHDGHTVMKALRTVEPTGVISGEPWPQRLERLAERERVGWVLALTAGALEQWVAAVGRRVQKKHDAIDQFLVAWEEARRLTVAGKLATWPADLSGFPIPSRAVVTTALSLVCPPGESVVVAAWEEGTLWTSVAMRRSTAGFDRIVGPDELRPLVEAAGPNHDTMWKTFLVNVRDRLGPVGLGVAAERQTWQTVVGSEATGWARAVAAGDILVEPLGRGMAFPLALDLGKGALSILGAVVGRPAGRRDAQRGGGSGLQQVARLWQVAQRLRFLQQREKQR